jgi:tetratricopeptide (TPR) repeat protein
LIVLALSVPPALAEIDPLAQALALSQEVIFLYQQGRYAEAIPGAREAVALYEKALGPENPGVAPSLNKLAGLLQDTGQYAAARPLLERALTIREQALGPTHPDLA